MNLDVTGAQVQAAAPPPTPPVTSTTPHRDAQDEQTLRQKQSVVHLNKKKKNYEERIVANGESKTNNDRPIVNRNGCIPNLENGKTSEGLPEPQKRDRVKPNNDLNSQQNSYEHGVSVVTNGKISSTQNNFDRIVMNDTSSRRNHDRSDDQTAKTTFDQRNSSKDLTKNGFTPPNDVKSYPIEEKKLKIMQAPAVSNMEVEVLPNSSSLLGQSKRFDIHPNEDKDHHAPGFREGSPLKETHGFDRHNDLIAHKDHQNGYDHLVAGDGSVRSDEGYHSHGYHDEVLTPPEDSSDSDDSDNNYVLDFR